MERHTNGGASSPASPTTFVQADTNSFRDLVQKLTGLPGDSADKSLPTRISSVPPRRPSFKLQERRQTIKKLEIQLGLTQRNKTHRPEFSILSPVTPLSSESLFFLTPGTESPSSPAAVLEEEKAIAEKGFYLHPSPLTTPRGSEPPELLTLFPLTSPCRRNQD
ncbi:VQ motif-containing protein 31-like [Euphorbia lathyris]|uniref:VQ motif-containing protein 31-like n=1 Tax=Euphorbia lathyris TaxID=212925 RepID=UPI003313DFE8